MYLFDFTLNLMTLLALSLVVGILVDDAIVVLENVYRHLEMGKNKWQATLDGVREIGITVVSTTLVLVVVFLPVALTKSIITPIINPFALVIVVSTMLSTLVALTVIPVLTSRFSRLEKIGSNSLAGRFMQWFERRIDAFGHLIGRVLVFALRHKPVTLVVASILFIASLGLIGGGFIGNEFISLGDRGEFMLQVELPGDASLKRTNQLTRQAEKIIFSHPQVTGVYTTVGSTSDFFAIQGGANKAEIQVKLADKTHRDKHSNLIAHELTEEIRRRIPGIRIRKAIANIAGGTDQSPVQLVIQSTCRDTLRKYAHLLLGKVSDIPGTTDTRLTIEGVNPEISVEIDKETMARLGITMDQVGLTMQTAFSGNDDAQFIDGEEQYDIHVTMDPFDRNNISDVQNLSFRNHMGRMVQLEQFADIQYQFTSNRQERYQRMPSITLESQVLGREAGVIGDEIAHMLSQTHLPNEIEVNFEGDLKYQEKAFGKLGFAFIASIFFVYLIMVALYNSYVYPFVVLFSIPLAIVGALLALALTKNALSLFSLLGMIMLIGIVTKNAILVVDFTNVLKARGYGTVHALFSATRLRLRPILMTSLSLIIGLLPIAIASGAAAEWKNGLAWVIIGGLTSSMLLTLVIVPVIYQLVDLGQVKLKRWLKNPSKKPSTERRAER
jgi:multidrug efflux pump subunit AcrB